MMLEKATSLRTIGWYLIARDGGASVRVRSGMQLGEDSSGELSLKPSNALVELDITQDGRLANPYYVGRSRA